MSADIMNIYKMEMIPREMKMGPEEQRRAEARRKEWLRKTWGNRMVNAR